jgi:hypothetical protein
MQGEKVEFYFKGYTGFSATIEWCCRLQLTSLAQVYWAGHPMVFREVLVYEYLFFRCATGMNLVESVHWQYNTTFCHQKVIEKV